MREQANERSERAQANTVGNITGAVCTIRISKSHLCDLCGTAKTILCIFHFACLSLEIISKTQSLCGIVWPCLLLILNGVIHKYLLFSKLAKHSFEDIIPGCACLKVFVCVCVYIYDPMYDIPKGPLQPHAQLLEFSSMCQAKIGCGNVPTF